MCDSGVVHGEVPAVGAELGLARVRIARCGERQVRFEHLEDRVERWQHARLSTKPFVRLGRHDRKVLGARSVADLAAEFRPRTGRGHRRGRLRVGQRVKLRRTSARPKKKLAHSDARGSTEGN